VNTEKIKVFGLKEILLRQDLTRLLYKNLGVLEEDQYQYVQDSSFKDLHLRLLCVNSMVKLIKEAA